METTSALFELATVSLACRDSDTLLKSFSARVGAELGARAVFVWLGNQTTGGPELACRVRWAQPGERFTPIEGPAQNGLLSAVFESGGTRRLMSREIVREDFSHL